MLNSKIIVLSAVVGAVAGVAVALAVTCGSKKIAVINVQEVVGSYAKVRELQVEQRANAESLAELVKKANEEISKEKREDKRKELELKYSEELAVKKAEMEKTYVEKLTKLGEELKQIISERAIAQGYKIVISKDAVVVDAGTKDITADLISAINDK